jgi:hypothetical protein
MAENAEILERGPIGSEASRAAEAALILGIPAFIFLSAGPAMYLALVRTHPSDYEATAFGAFANLAFFALILFVLGLRGLRSIKNSRFGPAALFAAIYWIFVAMSFVITVSSGNVLAGPRDVVLVLLLLLDLSLSLFWTFWVLRRSIVEGAWERKERAGR